MYGPPLGHVSFFEGTGMLLRVRSGCCASSRRGGATRPRRLDDIEHPQGETLQAVGKGRGVVGQAAPGESPGQIQEYCRRKSPLASADGRGNWIEKIEHSPAAALRRVSLAQSLPAPRGSTSRPLAVLHGSLRHLRKL